PSRLPAGELSRGLEAALAQRADAFVEHRLGALLLLFQQLLGHEAFGEEKRGRHARHGEKVGLGAEEAREIGALEKRALSLMGAVVRQQYFSVLHRPSLCFPSGLSAVCFSSGLSALICPAVPPSLSSHVRRRASAPPSVHSRRSTCTSRPGRAARGSSGAPDRPASS